MLPPDLQRGSTGSLQTVKPASFSRPRNLQVQALVVDAEGAIYAATSPDGKVYKIVHGGPAPGKTPEGTHTTAEVAAAQEGAKPAAGRKPATSVAVDSSYTSTVFFDPKTKYIWALALDKQGRLYVGTGDRGEIFRVERNGTGALFFKSDEAQIRALDFDNAGNLIAGTDGSGLVYRISPAGRRLRALQRAQEGDHRPRHRRARQHLCRGRRRKTRPACATACSGDWQRLPYVPAATAVVHQGPPQPSPGPARRSPPAAPFPTWRTSADPRSTASRPTARPRPSGPRRKTWSMRSPSISRDGCWRAPATRARSTSSTAAITPTWSRPAPTR